MKIKPSIFTFSLVILLSFALDLLANKPHQLLAETRIKNLGELSNDPDQLTSWNCRNQEDGILVEAKNDKTWKSIIEQKSWTCQEGLSDIPTGALKFSCEPTEDGIISILTVIWLTGKDKNKQMGQWIHQFSDEYNMVCSMAKVELLGD